MKLKNLSKFPNLPLTLLPCHADYMSFIGSVRKLSIDTVTIDYIWSQDFIIMIYTKLTNPRCGEINNCNIIIKIISTNNNNHFCWKPVDENIYILKWVCLTSSSWGGHEDENILKLVSLLSVELNKWDLRWHTIALEVNNNSQQW